MCLIPDRKADMWIPQELIHCQSSQNDSLGFSETVSRGNVQKPLKKTSQFQPLTSTHTCTDKCTFTSMPIACVQELTHT